MNHLATIASSKVSAGITGFVGRRELLLWTAVCLFANQAVMFIHFGSLSQLATDLANQNLVYWFACYVVLYRLNTGDSHVRASAYDWCFALTMLLAILLSSVIAYRFAIGFLACVMGLYLLAVHRADAQLTSAGAVLLALSAHLAWGPILFLLTTPELLRADATLVGGLLMLMNSGIVWTGTTFQSAGGHAISIVGACSSFENLSTALLACASAAMFLRTKWTRRDLAVIAVASVAMVLLNTLRLCLLAWSAASYQFWHEGQGAPLYGVFTTIVMLLIAFWPARSRGSRA